MLTEERRLKFERVAANRQEDLTIILENVHDPHNIGAVMRSCDAVGISEIYILYTDPKLYEKGVDIGYKSSRGSRKWVEVMLYNDRVKCFDTVRKKYKRILGTHLSEEASNLYELNLAGPVALLFGNEHEGISQESLDIIDGNFIIPQHGMVQSLNISVACAVSIFECSRQRIAAGKYNNEYQAEDPNQKRLMERYHINHKPRDKKAPGEIIFL